MSEIREKAREYAERGWKVFPLKPRGKEPLTPHGYKDATTDDDQILAWWKKWPDANVGIAVGESGLAVIDVDSKEGWDAWLDMSPGSTACVETGKGHHFYFKGTIRSTASKLAKGIDTRGSGGYVVAPPSIHPNGQKYVWSREEPILDLPLDIASKAAEEPKPSKPPVPADVQFTPSNGNGRYAEVAVEGEVEAILNAPEGTRNHQLNKSMFSLSQLVASGVLDESVAEQSMKEAAKIAGLSPREIEKTVVSASKAGKQKPREPKRISTREKHPKIRRKVLQRLGLDTPTAPKEKNLPTIPKELLPDWFGNYCQAVSKAHEVPFEMPVGLGLGVLATAAQRNVSVYVEGEYYEPLCLWVSCTMESGNRKTPVLGKMTAPLLDRERWLAERFEEYSAEIVADIKVRQSKIQNLTMEAGKADEYRSASIKQDIKELLEGMPEDPKCPRLLVQDVTPEHLGTMLADNKESLSIISDEGGLFDMIGGRYSDGIPNLDLYLQSFSGSAVRVDRGSREPVIMDNPRLTIALAPQPAVMQKLQKSDTMRGRGLIARFLFLNPPSNLGHRKLETEKIPLETKVAYMEGVQRILKTPPQTTITLSPEAHSIWKNFSLEIESQFLPGGMYHYAKDIGGKIPGHAIRIAGLLHLVSDMESRTISGETMDRAIRLVRIFMTHGMDVLSIIAEDRAESETDIILSEISRHPNGIGRTDLRKALTGCGVRREAFLEILETLLEAGVIAEEQGKRGKSGGRIPTLLKIVDTEGGE